MLASFNKSPGSNLIGAIPRMSGVGINMALEVMSLYQRFIGAIETSAEIVVFPFNGNASGRVENALQQGGATAAVSND